MSKESMALAFLKNNGVSYYLDKMKRSIFFPCPDCQKRIAMDTENTNWNCVDCSSKGNLSVLLRKDLRSKEKVTIYNPIAAKREIRTLLTKLILDHQDERIEKLAEKISKLIEYYEQ